MLSLFIVAFIVTLITAVYMQFGSQAERYVMQCRLHPDAFAFGGAVMFILALGSLSNSGFSNHIGMTILFISWIPCALIAVRIELIQKSFQELYRVGKELNPKRTKVGMKEMQAVAFFIEMERINNGQKNRVHRAILAHKRYYN
jgi:hypothetical protein